VADRLHSAALRLVRRLRAHDASVGLSPPRLSALAVIVRDGPIAVGALAAAEGVAAPTMSRLVDGLQREGLVKRTPDPADARGVLVTATPRGKSLLAKARTRRLRDLAEELSRLSAEELTLLARGADLMARIAREPA
jgi:DNA-binding MarR family transcriptional regulator